MMKEVLRRAGPPIAWVLFLGAGVIHTVWAWRYFSPTWVDLMDALPRPGPHAVRAWGAHCVRLLGAAVFFASCPGWGLWIWRRREGVLDVCVRAGLGLLSWSLMGLGAAAFGVSRPEILRGLSLIVAVGGLALGRADLASLGAGVGRLLRGRVPWSFGLIAPFAALYLLASIVPDVFYDALVYHLAVPWAYLQSGAWVDFPHIHLTRLPGLVQTLFLWGLAWSDDRLCKLQVLGMGVLAAAGLYAYAARRLSPEAGRWAALLFLSVPLIGIHAWSCAPDVPAALFLFLSVAILESPEIRERESLAAGVLFGAACAAKYTALAAAPYFLFKLGPWRDSGRFRTAALFAAASLLPLLPWWTRNALWTGNPFHPLLGGVLGGDTADNLALLPAWRADARGGEGFLARALSLFSASFVGVKSGRFGFLGPTLLMSVVFGFRRELMRRSLAWPALLAYPLFILSSGHLRYFVPLLPFLCLWGGAALGEHPPKAPGRRWRSYGVAGAVGLNLLWIALAFGRYNQGWPVVWGRQTPADYLKSEHVGLYGHPSQGAFDHIRNAGGRPRVFLVGEARTYRSPGPTLASGNFNRPPFSHWLEGARSPAEIVASLRREGYTHLVVNAAELLRITPAPYRTPEHIGRLNEVLAHLGRPSFHDAWCLVFDLAGEGGGGWG